MVLTLVLCGAFTALGLALIPAMLALMNTPAEVLPESTAYLSIYFSGITGLLIYNMGSGILRAWATPGVPSTFWWCRRG